MYGSLSTGSIFGHTRITGLISGSSLIGEPDLSTRTRTLPVPCGYYTLGTVQILHIKARGSPPQQMLHHVARITPVPGYGARGCCELDMQADEIQTRLLFHDTADVDRLLMCAEHGQVDPRKIGHETSCPDHVVHFEPAAIIQHWLAILYAGNTAGPYHTRSKIPMGHLTL